MKTRTMNDCAAIDHQIKQTQYYHWLIDTFSQESFDGFLSKDLDLFFSHIDGCWVIDFDEYLGLNDDTVRNSKIPRGLIKAKKRPNPEMNNRLMFWMNNDEIVRCIDLVRNWVKAITVAKNSGFQPKTFRRFVRRQEFGLYQKDLEGDLAINKKVLIDISKKYQELASKHLIGYSPTNGDVISMRTFARRLNIADHCLRPNLRRREIDFESDGTAYLVTEKAFMKFVQDVVDNRYDTSPKVAIECYKILKLSPDERAFLFQERNHIKRPSPV